MSVKEIGEIISLRRNKFGLNQEDLAELAGITTKTVYLVESGIGNPSLVTLQKLLDVLGLEITIDVKILI
jgi:transcriptional regulator with XRE-family HTH domain